MSGRYVFQVWVTVEAESLDDAIRQAHNVTAILEDPYGSAAWDANVVDTFIGDEYERVINEFGDTVPADDED